MDTLKVSKDNKKGINDIKSSISLINVKSDFFLEKLFDNVPKNLFFTIVKYNKKVQKRLKINIQNYKEYSEYLQIFSPIEIEVIPIKNKYGKFININEKDPLYHIYFNDDKEEIKKNTLDKDDKVSKIKIIIDHQEKSLACLFYNCICIKTIDFKKFYRNNIADMHKMFDGCYFLREINLTNFKTNNVIDMSDMFNDCSFLKAINLSKFNTNNVTNMSGMFGRCSSLKELNLSNFNTNNVTDMSGMFSGCLSLKELNLSNFNTNNVTDMRYMFQECSSLKVLNLDNFVFNSEVNMEYIFYECCNELKMKIKAQYEKFKEEAFK